MSDQNLPKIKTKKIVHDIKVLDRGKLLSDRMKKAAARAKDTGKNLVDDGQVTPEEYASDRLRDYAEEAAGAAGRTVKPSAKRTRNRLRDGARRHNKKKKDRIPSETGQDEGPAGGHVQRDFGPLADSERRYGNSVQPRSAVRRKETAPVETASVRGNSTCSVRETTATTSQHSPGNKVRFPSEHGQPEKTGRFYTGEDSAVLPWKRRQPFRSPKKQTIKTREFLGETVKIAEKESRTIKTAIRSADRGVKTAEIATQTARDMAIESAKNSQRAAELVRRSAAAVSRNAKDAAAAASKAVKAIGESAKSLITAMAAGGSVVMLIMVIVLMAAMIGGSVFAIFFSGEDTGTGMTMRDAVRQINSDYQARIQEIKDENTYDELVMTGTRANWREVLAVYAVSVNSDPENPQEVAGMDAARLLALTRLFWEMNEISDRVETEIETVIETDFDENGQPIVTENEISHTILYITVGHRTAEEMADRYGFSAEQQERLAELLSDESASLWNAALYGIDFSGDIIDVALSQVGNSGDIYWSYMGFSSRVEWCACFVSWCANECGYLTADILPNTASCVGGESWFKARDQWQDKTYTPKPGDIIYFDWDKLETDGQDGTTDHVGIVEKVEDGRIYTIEGNSGDKVSHNTWAVGHDEIYGYGIPIYE